MSPTLVLLDVNETLTDREPLRAVLTDAGPPRLSWRPGSPRPCATGIGLAVEATPRPGALTGSALAPVFFRAVPPPP